MSKSDIYGPSMNFMSKYEPISKLLEMFLKKDCVLFDRLTEKKYNGFKCDFISMLDHAVATLSLEDIDYLEAEYRRVIDMFIRYKYVFDKGYDIDSGVFVHLDTIGATYYYQDYKINVLGWKFEPDSFDLKECLELLHDYTELIILLLIEVREIKTLW